MKERPAFEDDLDKEAEISVSSRIAAKKPTWKGALLPSLGALSLGIIGGLFLFLLRPSPQDRPRSHNPSLATSLQARDRSGPSASDGTSKAGATTGVPSSGDEGDPPEGRDKMQACLLVAAQGSMEGACAFLQEPAFKGLRPAVLWVAAEGSLRAGRPAQAVALYEELLRLSPTFWTRKALGLRYAEALIRAGKPKEASAIFDSALREKSVLPAGAWVAREIERRETSASLLLAARQETKDTSKAFLFATLAAFYPDSPLMAEAQKTWLETWSRLSKKERKRHLDLLLVWLEDALRRGDPARPVAAWLREAAKLKPSSKAKLFLARLEAAWAWQHGTPKQTLAALQTYVKLLPRREQAEGWFLLTSFALEEGKASLAGRFFRKIRGDKKLWKAKYDLQQIHSALAGGRWRPAASLIRRVWRSSARQTPLRALLSLWAAFLALEKKQAKRALKEIRAALDLHKKAGSAALTSLDELLFWQARILEILSKPNEAKPLYRALFERTPFSFFGLFASRRLALLDDPVPLPSLPQGDPSWDFRLNDLPQTSEQPLRLLYLEGPHLPGLLAFETYLLQEIKAKRSLPPGLLLAFVRRCLALGFPSAALRWLASTLRPLSQGSRPEPPDLWAAAFPSLAFFFLEPPTSSRGLLVSSPRLAPSPLPSARSRSGFDPRLEAAFWLSFQPSFSRPFRSSFELLSPLPSERIASFLWLRALLDTWKDAAQALSDPALALAGLPPLRRAPLLRLKRAFRSLPDEMLYHFLPPLAQQRLRLAWLYPIFHLP